MQCHAATSRDYSRSPFGWRGSAATRFSISHEHGAAQHCFRVLTRARDFPERDTVSANRPMTIDFDNGALPKKLLGKLAAGSSPAPTILSRILCVAQGDS